MSRDRWYDDVAVGMTYLREIGALRAFNDLALGAVAFLLKRGVRAAPLRGRSLHRLASGCTCPPAMVTNASLSRDGLVAGAVGTHLHSLGPLGFVGIGVVAVAAELVVARRHDLDTRHGPHGFAGLIVEAVRIVVVV